jgi:N-methylhydantoinase A
VAGERFHEAHEQRYGYSYRHSTDPGTTGRQTMEWVNLRVTGIGPIARPRLRELPTGDGPLARALTGKRTIVFDEKSVECPVYERTRLAPGDTLNGPAIVEEYGATTVVYPGQRIVADRFGNLILTRGAA